MSAERAPINAEIKPTSKTDIFQPGTDCLVCPYCGADKSADRNVYSMGFGGTILGAVLGGYFVDPCSGLIGGLLIRMVVGVGATTFARANRGILSLSLAPSHVA